MKIGLGTWRFFLAFLVVISHLWENMIHGPAAYAVWGFFSLSGYLMTHVLRFKYGQSAQGLRDFAYNRFLRIYPMYFVACLFGVAALVFSSRLGVQPTLLNPEFRWPQDWISWLKNLTLLPIAGGGKLVPVSGALAVEVGAYVLMSLMAFSRPAAWLALILSLLMNASYGFEAGTFGTRYSAFLTCFWVFAAGSLVSHYKDRLAFLRAPKLSVAVWLLQCLVWLKYDQWPWTYGLYFSVLLSSWVILSIESQKSSRLDTILGDLSYPIYLFHTVIAVFLLMGGMVARTFPFFMAAFIITLVISWVLVATIDRRINAMKRRKAIADVPLSFDVKDPA